MGVPRTAFPSTGLPPSSSRLRNLPPKTSPPRSSPLKASPQRNSPLRGSLPRDSLPRSPSPESRLPARRLSRASPTRWARPGRTTRKWPWFARRWRAIQGHCRASYPGAFELPAHFPGTALGLGKALPCAFHPPGRLRERPLASRVVQVRRHRQQLLLPHLRKLDVVVHVVSPPFM